MRRGILFPTENKAIPPVNLCVKPIQFAVSFVYHRQFKTFFFLSYSTESEVRKKSKKMYGQKEIISCMVIVTLVAILNYYRSIMKRDKEIQSARRSFLEKQKMEEKLLEAERAAFNREQFLRKMLEYSDRCYDIHALIYRPKDYDFVQPNTIQMVNSTEPLDLVDANEKCSRVLSENKAEFTVVKGKESSKKSNDTARDTSSIVYVLVTVLLGSLVKAALDVTKHYKKVSVADANIPILY